MKNIEPIYFNNLAFVQSKVSNNILEQLKNETRYILKNNQECKKYNQRLARNVEREKVSDKTRKILKPDLISLANEFYKYEKNSNENFPNWDIKNIWINYQKKYECNFLHSHSGNLSFVIWVQIPYDIKNELKFATKISNENISNLEDYSSYQMISSTFKFVYTDFLGKLCNFEMGIDKSSEGNIIMFPSALNHIVYPFYTSDDYRISIAGNLNNIKAKNNIFSYQ